MKPEDKEKNDAKMRVIFGEVFNLKNEASINALQVIKSFSGFDQSNVYMDQTGDIAEGVNLYNEGRRSLYLDIRKHLSDDVLFEVEIKRRAENAKKKR